MNALRKGALLAVGVVAVAGVVLVRDHPPQPVAPEPVERPLAARPAPAPAAPPAAPESDSGPAAPSSAPGEEGLPRWSAEEKILLDPEPALESARQAVRNFALRFKGNPVGNNAEITAALHGDNPARARFLDPAVHRVNELGEWVDGWGRPYFFHQLSGEQMEIRSAGPDRILWTLDDLVLR